MLVAKSLVSRLWASILQPMDQLMIFQSLGPQPFWQIKRCSRTAQDNYALTTPSLLSRGSHSRNRFRQGGPARLRP